MRARVNETRADEDEDARVRGSEDNEGASEGKQDEGR